MDGQRSETPLSAQGIEQGGYQGVQASHSGTEMHHLNGHLKDAI